ncbi:hypothetical protein [Azospirillum picis]|uniref:Uncharacterized protein n=1 Tax=Azospirillum picis TaxID=488438 RepID=A0ABU0ME21_9PROT|nr:hypothetical protein [Azospirillum picis]MBP2297846.1 hypothetical protein [Azospirillum picis]MDQ0531684.1 hypothetical protein [Azospirillum picis]
MMEQEKHCAAAFCNGEQPLDMLLPYIGHLTSAQLRERAANDRDDAAAMAGRASPACILMLLEDAERCEARAELLEREGRRGQAAGQEVATAGLAFGAKEDAGRGRAACRQAGCEPGGRQAQDARRTPEPLHLPTARSRSPLVVG